MLNSAILQLIAAIIGGLVASVVIVVVGLYLIRDKQAPVAEDVLVLGWLSKLALKWQLAGPVLVAMLVSAALSLVATPVAMVLRDHHLTMDSLLDVLPGIIFDNFGFTLLNYFVWGGLSLFVYAMAKQRSDVDHRVFTTAGFLGGVFHQSTCSLGAFYIGQFALAKIQPTDLYALRPEALFRLWAPLFLESLSAGILLSYYIAISRNVAFVQQFYVNRFKLALILVTFLVLIYPGVLGLGGSSFVIKALRYNNVGLIWWTTVGVCTIAILLGTVVFDRTIKPRWLTGIVGGGKDGKGEDGKPPADVAERRASGRPQ